MAGDNPQLFLDEIIQPWFALPFTAWIVVAFAYYLIIGAVFYHILCAEKSIIRTQIITLTLTIVFYNEFWNYLLFASGSLTLAFASLIPFIGCVIYLYIKLRKFNYRLSLILIPYLIWLAYDLAWTYSLWILN